MNNNHLSALRNKHAELEQKLEREENRPLPDSKVILDLKKQKLQLKDALMHESALTG
ncbi:YdcH family protein [Sphingorhabdus sp.]|uniref:YdcH family protein n=1 Tax=Sphingorhabdus sp. TaxID=1902408 RepID=UPI00391C5D50